MSTDRCDASRSPVFDQAERAAFARWYCLSRGGTLLANRAGAHPPGQWRDPMRSVARSAHLAVAALLVAGLFVQIFLAGLGVFRGPERFATHRDFGFMLEALPILLLVLAMIASSNSARMRRISPRSTR